MPRYVILEHDHPHRHWDLMLEAGELLRTWRLDSPPRHEVEVRAEAFGDHRIIYLDYEGPVSGGRGHVQRWDAGTFLWLQDDADRMEVRVEGQRCRGDFRLVRGDTGAWSLHYTATQ